MPPDLRDPTRPDEWLRRARSNLALARAHSALPDVLLEDLCFDAQQSAEKAIKAVLVHHQIEFPKTHVLAQLLDLLAKHGVQSPEGVREATRFLLDERTFEVAEVPVETNGGRSVEGHSTTSLPFIPR